MKGLTTSLIGRMVAPAPGLLHVWPVSRKCMTPFFPEAEELLYSEAEIIAAWTDRKNVMIATVGPNGETREFFLTNVRLLPRDPPPPRELPAPTRMPGPGWPEYAGPEVKE